MSQRPKFNSMQITVKIMSTVYWPCKNSFTTFVVILTNRRKDKQDNIWWASKCNIKCLSFITSAKEVMVLLNFVCLSVCLSVCQQNNSKSYGRIFLKFSGNGKNYQWFNFGGWYERNPGFWITVKFSLTLLLMGHKGNRCQTEYGAATWRTTWPWRRSAGSDCFPVLLLKRNGWKKQNSTTRILTARVCVTASVEMNANKHNLQTK